MLLHSNIIYGAMYMRGTGMTVLPTYVQHFMRRQFDCLASRKAGTIPPTHPFPWQYTYGQKQTHGRCCSFTPSFHHWHYSTIIETD